jgi:hypothetical protein
MARRGAQARSFREREPGLQRHKGKEGGHLHFLCFCADCTSCSVPFRKHPAAIRSPRALNVTVEIARTADTTEVGGLCR